SAPAGLADLELVITRVFDAPRGLVFKMWTDPRHLARWWGPQGFTLPSCDIELRAGGAYNFHMRGPEGDEHWSRGIIREFVEPERLVLVGGWTDAAGIRTSPESETTISFEDQGSKTKLTLRSVVFESVSSRDAHRGGWNSSLDRLAEYLATV